MAKKTRKQKQRSATRRQAPGIPGGAGLTAQTVSTVEEEPVADERAVASPVVSAPVVSSAPSAAPASPSGRRRVERLNTAASPTQPARPGRVPQNVAAMFAPLEPDDAAIPFDRVPYVPADLRRVAVMAGVMIVVIIIAAVIVSHVVK